MINYNFMRMIVVKQQFWYLGSTSIYNIHTHTHISLFFTSLIIRK